MKTVLITGAGPNGVTGRILKESLCNRYSIVAPNSSELDLTNSEQVAAYFNTHSIDFVIHCATFRPLTANKNNFVNEELESNLRMYFNLSSQAHKIEKMVYFGSGAEFDKSRNIVSASEESFGESIPKDRYGFAKYLMFRDAQKSANIYNIRIFGTISPYERFTKNVVSNLCVKAIKGLPITLRQDCRFSFVYIPDLLRVLECVLAGSPKYHDYNVAMNKSCFLSDIAKIVLKRSGRSGGIEFSQPGLNREYTASNERVVNEFCIEFTPIREAVESVYRHYESMVGEISATDIDSRWRAK